MSSRGLWIPSYNGNQVARVVKKLSRGRSCMKNWVRRTIGFEMSAGVAETGAEKRVPAAGFQRVFGGQRVRALTQLLRANEVEHGRRQPFREPPIRPRGGDSIAAVRRDVHDTRWCRSSRRHHLQDQSAGCPAPDDFVPRGSAIQIREAPYAIVFR
jgi:hypothetical protein